MKILSVLVALLLVGISAFAQGVANGQVYLPNGQPARQQIRIDVQRESGRQGPYSVYTDLMGRFELRDLVSLSTYVLTVETDNETWATTSVTFIPSGTNPRAMITLRPLQRISKANSGSVSVGSLQQNVPSEARKEYEAATKFIRKNDYASARPHLEKAIELYPIYVDAHNEMGVALMRENQLPEAEVHFRKALEIDPAAIHPTMNLGLCLSRRERFADAVPVLEKAVQLAGTEPTGHLLLGLGLLKTGELDKAEASLKRAYELGGKRASQALYYLATLYVQRNDPAQAAEALEAYLKDNPDAPNAAQLREEVQRLRAAAAPPKP